MVKSRGITPRRLNVRETTERRDDTQRFGEMIDLAATAKQIADSLDERFLAYLLAMVIQEISHVESRRAEARVAAPRQDQPERDAT